MVSLAAGADGGVLNCVRVCTAEVRQGSHVPSRELGRDTCCRLQQGVRKRRTTRAVHFAVHLPLTRDAAPPRRVFFKNLLNTGA